MAAAESRSWYCGWRTLDTFRDRTPEQIEELRRGSPQQQLKFGKKRRVPIGSHQADRVGAWCAAGTRAPHRPSRPGWRALSRLPGSRIIRSNVEARRRLRRACSNDKGGQVMRALITGGRVTHGCPTRGEAPDIFKAYDMAVSSCSLRPLTPFWLLR